MFTHYLITRFNIKIAEHGPERMSSPVIDEAWMKDRIHLFLTYCVPAVLDQKNSNFTWLIYFDTHTPASALAQIIFPPTPRPKIEFAFADDFDHMLKDIKARFTHSANPFVISSRLDNDDVIGNQFIQCIQKAFVPESNTVININSGYVYDLKKKVLTLWRNKLTNQFSSLIESTRPGDCITIYGFPHWKPPALSKTIAVLDQPCWIEMVHPANNRARGSMGIPVFSKHLSSFPKVIRELRISLWNTFMYALAWLPAVVVRRLSGLFK